jgi:hypothetical protein
MRRSLGRWSETGRCGSRVFGPLAATYAHTGTAVAFIISELPGERAEALFIAKAAWVPTAGEQVTNRPGLRLRVTRDQRVRHVG